MTLAPKGRQQEVKETRHWPSHDRFYASADSERSATRRRHALPSKNSRQRTRNASAPMARRENKESPNYSPISSSHFAHDDTAHSRRSAAPAIVRAPPRNELPSMIHAAAHEVKIALPPLAHSRPSPRWSAAPDMLAAAGHLVGNATVEVDDAMTFDITFTKTVVIPSDELALQFHGQ